MKVTPLDSRIPAVVSAPPPSRSMGRQRVRAARGRRIRPMTANSAPRRIHLWIRLVRASRLALGTPYLQAGPVDDAAVVIYEQVLLHHLGDPQVTESLARGVHRGDRGVLPGLGAGPDDIDDSVHAHGILLDSGPLFLTQFPGTRRVCP